MAKPDTAARLLRVLSPISIKLAKQQVEQLLREGRTARIEGFTSKAGKPFAARLKLGEATGYLLPDRFYA